MTESSFPTPTDYMHVRVMQRVLSAPLAIRLLAVSDALLTATLAQNFPPGKLELAVNFMNYRYRRRQRYRGN